MDLADALGLGADELVSFVGAGGKKTAMRRLISEAVERGLEAGYTTSAHMPPPSDLPLVLADADRIAAGSVDVSTPVALASSRVPDPVRVDEKVRGYRPTALDSIFDSGRFDWLLVKADGARMREFKAPGPDEPPIPETSTVVVPVVSVLAVGRPLADDIVHRVERVERCADISAGERITADVVGRVLAHPEGGLKHVPDDATVVPLVNKADDDAHERRATAAIETALERTSRFDRGIVASLETNRLTLVA